MICLDTSIVIWGVRGLAGTTSGQEHMVPLAEKYIRYLKHRQEPILLPTPVLAEYLAGSNFSERREGLIFRQGFQIQPFDIPAAAKAAELARIPEAIRDIQKAHGTDRQAVKVDLMILAIAIVHQAEKVITWDAEMMRELAQGQIKVESLPEIKDESDPAGTARV